jgi:hypothetical protein
MKKLISLSHPSCVVASCPAVYSSEDGKQLFIVGKKVDDLKGLGIEDKVSDDEQVIVIDREIVRQVLEVKK